MDVNLIFQSNASGTIETATGTVSFDAGIVGLGFIIFIGSFLLLLFILKHD